MKTAIVWFKTDLRLYDNEALIKLLLKVKSYTCIVLMMPILNRPMVLKNKLSCSIRIITRFR
jgi:deoxyribodipyrimidine photolyase